MLVGGLCQRRVDDARPGETVSIAAERMLHRDVGTLVVLGERNEPLGIVTDRDLALRVLARGSNPETTTVADVMTDTPVTVVEDTTAEVALRAMREVPCRRLPVLGRDGQVVGIVSIDDLLRAHVTSLLDVVHLLEQQVPLARDV